ncbi:MAG TPA: hypothetical protein DE312_10340 [Gallionella sp.]|nr:MAG: hypothetical protein A2Z87_01590 [Gallionellales bacterium GWA2_54_124]OGT17317.1 MAG: hypothetical protein A2522_08420 [Gallionellales bacterium RIFOXYD12_FULL_53_10]HCI53693.1 hypothetical protein [Gallionella sp.]
MTFITTNKLRIFLVEDNADLREEMIFGLTSLGIEAFGFGDAQSLYRELAARECDVLVIDVGLPGEDGFSIAEHLSGNLSRGIILLTARAELEDRLRGLELGADAYLVKPTDVRELAANAYAVARRISKTGAESAIASSRNEQHEMWALCAGGWILRNPQGVQLSLSEIERRFLEVMVASSGQVVERKILIAAFSADNPNYDPHRIDALVSRLRKRTELAGLGILPVQSVRGTGYIFTPFERRANFRGGEYA